MPSEQPGRHNTVYMKGCALIEGEIWSGETPRPTKPGWWVRRKLRRAIVAFDEAISIRPGNWAAHWLVGKIHQRLGENEATLRRFARAHDLEPTNADVAREATIAAIEVGEALAARRFSEVAMALAPSDAGLVANHAVALLIAGDASGALRAIQKALALDPNDRISCDVRDRVLEVLAGRRTPPRNGNDLWALPGPHVDE